jgi:hypothetical protein
MTVSDGVGIPPGIPPSRADGAGEQLIAALSLRWRSYVPVDSQGTYIRWLSPQTVGAMSGV